MATEIGGYVAPWYYVWYLLDTGGKSIGNGSENHIMKKYPDGWDNPRVYRSDDDWHYV